MLHNLDTLDLSVLQTIQTISYEDHDLNENAHDSPELLQVSGQVVELKQILGEGGMGVVYLAEQKLPKRDVAVKKLRSEASTYAESLYREAMLTGSLEHPNIVPVHLVCMEDPTSPEVVMKYIQGRSLDKLCTKDGVTGEELRDCLGCLIQVCHALEYAHSREIIHRDIKPSNIMIGEFGEVYLLDWGIGVELGCTHSPALLVGTPAYIAPEMLTGKVQEVCPQTDVYLLGATLHHLLTGTPRHSASSVTEALAQAKHSAPVDFPPTVSTELAELCNHACAANRKQRLGSVADFRQTLEHHLEHWQALRLVEVAESERDKLYSQLADVRQLSAQKQQFDRVCFAFSQALHIWSNCPAALSGLSLVQQRMLQHYVGLEELTAAEELWERMNSPDPLLQGQISQLRQRHQHQMLEQERLQQIGAANDPNVSKAARRALAIATAILSALFIAMLLSPIGQLGFSDPQILFFVSVALFAPMVLTIWLFRRAFIVNVHGQRAVLAVTSALTGMVLHRGLAWHFDQPAQVTIVVDMLLVALATINAAPSLRRGPLIAAVALLTIPVCVLVPDSFVTTGVLIGMVMGGSILYEWVFERERFTKSTS